MDNLGSNHNADNGINLVPMSEAPEKWLRKQYLPHIGAPVAASEPF